MGSRETTGTKKNTCFFENKQKCLKNIRIKQNRETNKFGAKNPCLSKFAKNRKNCQKSAKIAKILKNQKLIKMLSPILPYNFRTLPYPSVHFRTPGSVHFRTLPYARGFNQKSSFEPKVWKTTFFVFFGEKMSPRGDFLIF